MAWSFADADDFHPEENKNLMQNGIPLTDENRMPWLESIRNHLIGWAKNEESGVLACSALKQKYRHFLNQGLKNSLFFLFLNADQAVIQKRLESTERSGHFLTDPLRILPSQIAALELPSRGDSIETLKSGYLCKETTTETNSYYFIYVMNCTAEITLDISLNIICNQIMSIKSIKELR